MELFSEENPEAERFSFSGTKPETFSAVEAIDQKVFEAFREYPPETARAIDMLFRKFRSFWNEYSRLKRLGDSRYAGFESVVRQGNIVLDCAPVEKSDTPAMDSREQIDYQQLETFLQRYERTRPTYGMTITEPETKFYLSLQDTSETPDAIMALTTGLKDLAEQGLITFWQYKIETAPGESLRFGSEDRDKGGSPIIYVDDAGISAVEALLEQVYQRYPKVFSPQTAPFKYSPHGTNGDGWHIAMEAQGLANTKGTPEQGMRHIAAEFFSSLGLTTTGWQPLSGRSSTEIRTAWEQACKKLNRHPDRPYLTTDRPIPTFFQDQMTIKA